MIHLFKKYLFSAHSAPALVSEFGCLQVNIEIRSLFKEFIFYRKETEHLERRKPDIREGLKGLTQIAKPEESTEKLESESEKQLC